MQLHKLLGISTLANLISMGVYSQVHWEYRSKKISEHQFEIHLTARLENGWHLYSQTQPVNSIVLPATITFNKNPSVHLQGATKEIGKKETYENKELGIKSYQYSSSVDFVQVVKMENKVSTQINGSISFMACTDQTCLPETTQHFSISLDK